MIDDVVSDDGSEPVNPSKKTEVMHLVLCAGYKGETQVPQHYWYRRGHAHPGSTYMCKGCYNLAHKEQEEAIKRMHQKKS